MLYSSSMSKKRYTITATTFDKRGRAIAHGMNSYARTHPRQQEYAAQAGQEHRLYLHAEIHAIIRSRKTKIHKILIERYDQQGRPQLAKPCAVCELAIQAAKIKFVEYTVGDNKDI